MKRASSWVLGIAVLSLLIPMVVLVPLMTPATATEHPSWYLSQSERFRLKLEQLEWRCDDSDFLSNHGNVLLWPVAQSFDFIQELLEQLDIDKRRQPFTKRTLPIIHVYMSDGAFSKLDQIRERAMAEKVPYIWDKGSSLVKSKILVDDGEQKLTPVMLRLKGTSPEHFWSSDRMSFKIRTRDDQTILGMTEFSLHIPSARNYQIEPLIHSMMRQIGVLAPNYFFCELWVNGKRVGITAVEERLGKEVFERNGRRSGSFLSFEDEWINRQRFLYNNRMSETVTSALGKINAPYSPQLKGNEIHFENIPLVPKDLPIKIINARKGQSTDQDLLQSQRRGTALLRDYLEGRLSASEVFDYQIHSLWWILAHLWGGYHGLTFSNWPMFYNMLTQKIEMVSWDNDADPNSAQSDHCVPTMGQYSRWAQGTDICIHHSAVLSGLLSDSRYVEILRANINYVHNIVVSSEFKDWLNSEQSKLLQILNLDKNNTPKAVTVEDLQHRLLSLQRNLDSWIADAHSARVKDSSSTASNVKTLDGLTKRQIEILHHLGPDDIYNHIRPFALWSQDKSYIEVKNLTLSPIVIESISTKGNRKHNLLTSEIVLPGYQGTNAHVFSMPVNSAEISFEDKPWVTYSYLGNQFVRPMHLQSRNFDNGYESQETTLRQLEKIGAILDQKHRVIEFHHGYHKLTLNLETPLGWSVKLLPGTVIEFAKGSSLKINGSIHSLGTEELPVRVLVQSNPNHRRGTSWGGLLIFEADRKSVVRHTLFSGTDSIALPNRQDSYALTGCITFYKSDVVIEQSKFSQMHCEDALNVINSKYQIDRTEFDEISFDAFDADFSNGTVERTSFSRIGNDAIDLSGGPAQITESRFSGIKDKAISVGENSFLTGASLTIENSRVGIASKDSSEVEVNESSFKGINHALMAYNKKKLWGPASLHCFDCRFQDITNIAVEQFGSQITLGGREISSVPLTREQLEIVGYRQ